MADVITADDWGAIAAFFASGGEVTVCPPVAFRPVPLQFPWLEGYRPPSRAPHSRAPSDEVVARRKRFLDLADGSRMIKDIARQMGCSVWALKADVIALRAQGVTVRMRKRGGWQGVHKGMGKLR